MKRHLQLIQLICSVVTKASITRFLRYFERTSSPGWVGFLQGAPWHTWRFGHLSVQPRHGSVEVEVLGGLIIWTNRPFCNSHRVVTSVTYDCQLNSIGLALFCGSKLRLGL